MIGYVRIVPGGIENVVCMTCKGVICRVIDIEQKAYTYIHTIS
jgi:hypothetical protein